MSEDIVAKAEALYSKLDFDSIQPRQYWTYERYFDAAKMLPGLVAEVKRLRSENERAERAHESLDAMRKRQLAAKDAEICILKTEACAAQKNIERRDDDIDGLMKELARWQDIATEQHALIHSIEKTEEYAYSEHVILSDKELEQAANELSIQSDDLTAAYMLGGQKANERLKVLQEYVKRLEKEYIDAMRLELYLRKYSKRGDIMLSDAYDLAEKEAQATLEKIRHVN